MRILKSQNRTREVQIIVRVTPEEKEKITERMKSIPIRDMSKYARKMLLNGLIINLDLTQFHELANEINKIGININQTVKIANTNGNIAPTEIAELQGGVDAIWQLLKSSLSKIQSINQ